MTSTDQLELLKERLKRAEATNVRLLCAAFFNYTGDASELVRLLLSQASEDTLTRFESLLGERPDV